MGLIGAIVKIVGILVLLVVGIGAFLYFTDYEAKAAVTDTSSEGGRHYATVTPKLVPWWHYKAEIPSEASAFVCKGYQVHFRLQTHDVKIYDQRDETLVYDSATQRVNQVEALRCAGSQGGIL